MTAAALLTAVFAGACGRVSEPEKSLYDYATAVQSRRCGEAVEFLSMRTRHALEYLKAKPQDPQSPVPIEEYYCSKFAFEDCKIDKTALISSGPERAKVTMPCGRTQDGILPGFPSVFLKYEPREMDLVREGDEWHVELPFVIRIVEIREKEDQLREAAMRERQRRRETLIRNDAEPPKPSL